MNPRIIVQPSHLRGTSKNPIYLYYDSSQVVTNDGNLHLPTTVYDANGRSIPLANLAQKSVYLEPPPILNAIASKQSSHHVTIPQRIALDLSQLWKNHGNAMNAGGKRIFQKNGRLYNDSIIVGTVAVMALLIGAMSARRLRSKSFLASCIENEALIEEEVAYDTAYTTTTTQKNGGGYDTFRKPWKGSDLEKFDV
jgi:hypothetical protein